MRALTAVFPLLFFSATCIAQSFDCTRAATPREQAICSNADLRELDTVLGREYKRVHSGVPPASAPAILTDQRAWLRESDAACTAKARGEISLADCLRGQYTSRLNDLQQDLDLGNGHWLLRLRGRDGTFPVIRPATPAEAEWNRTIHARLASETATAENDLRQCQKDGSLLPAEARDGMEVNVDWRVAAANQHFITVRTEQMAFCGGAHPSTSFKDGNWSLDTGRALTVDEVFEKSTQWRPALIERAKDRLRKLDDFTQYSGGDMIKGADTIVRDTSQWQPTREGLRLQFQQYQVAAYVFGMPAITIPWSELKPFLNPTWQPEQLPAPLPDPNSD